MLRSFLLPIILLLVAAVVGLLQLIGIAGNIAFVASLARHMSPEAWSWVAAYGALAIASVGFVWFIGIVISRKWFATKPRLRVTNYGTLGPPGCPFVINVQNVGSETGQFEGQISRLKSAQIFIPHASLLATWLGAGSKESTLLPGQRDIVYLGGLAYKWDASEEKHMFQIVLQYKTPAKPTDSMEASTKWYGYKGNEKEGVLKPRLDVEITFSSRPAMEGGPLVKRYLLMHGAMYETTKRWDKVRTWYLIKKNRYVLGEGPVKVQVQVQIPKP